MYSLDATPIFIIGNRRSGTTLIAYLLNTSEHIAAIPEVFFAGQLAASDQLISAGHGAKTFLKEPFPQFLQRLGHLADDMYADYTRRMGKRRWVSK